MDFNLDTAKMPELYKVATQLGIEYKLPIKKDDLIALIEPHMEDKSIKINLDAEQPVKVGNKQVKLMIHESSDEHAVNPVFVGYNGKGYTINRGQEVEVPEAIANILADAKETVYDKRVNEHGELVMTPREALSYPYTILG